MSKRNIIKGDYTVAFHSGSAKDWQPIVGNYSVSEEVTREHTGFSWEGSQGEPAGDYPQFEGFESGFGGRFLSFMSRSSDWGFCNDKYIHAQGGDPLTPLYSSPQSFIARASSMDLNGTSRTPIIGKQNKFTKDGKLYTILSPLERAGMVGICEYKRILGGEGENDRWEISDYIPIGTASFSTMDQNFHYTIVTGNSWNSYIAANNAGSSTGDADDLARIFDQSQIYWDVHELEGEKYLAVNLMSEFWVDPTDEAKGREGTWLNTVPNSAYTQELSPRGDQNWFIIMYRSGSASGWRQETALTPKLLYDYLFKKDQNGARVNLRLLDQDPQYSDQDALNSNPRANFSNREAHFKGKHYMLRWYIRRYCDASDRTIRDFDGDIMGDTYNDEGSRYLINEGAWLHENAKIYNGEYSAGGSNYTINGTNTAAVNHRAFPWMDGWMLDHNAQAQMTQVKFCVPDENPQMKLATISNGDGNAANCMIVHKSSSADGWEVEDFVYVSAQAFSQTQNLVDQNWTYSPSRNEFYFSNLYGKDDNFIQIISSASSGIYFEPDAVTWQYLNVPNSAESSNVTVEVFDQSTATYSAYPYLEDHHTGSFSITDHENNVMTITIAVNPNLSEPIVSGQAISHPGSITIPNISAHYKSKLSDRIVEAVNNGGPLGTGDYHLTASLVIGGNIRSALIQSTVSSSIANGPIDDQIVGDLLSTDIRFSNLMQRVNNDISTFYPVGQAVMSSGSTGPRLSGRGGFRSARMLEASEIANQSLKAIYYTGSVNSTTPAGTFISRPMNRYFTIDEDGEVSDYHEAVYRYGGVQNYLVQFGEDMVLGSDRIDLIQLQRTGVLGETTDGPEGPEWLRMWENTNYGFGIPTDPPDPATQYDRYHAFWNRSEAPFIQNFGKLMKTDSYGRLYVLGAGKKEIPGTDGVHDGNPDGWNLSLQNRVYVLNKDVNNPKAGSSGWYVEHVFFDPDYQDGGPLAGEDGYYWDKMKDAAFYDWSKSKYFYGGFGANIAVNEFAEEGTTNVFISAPRRVSDEITGITYDDLQANMPFRSGSTTSRLSVYDYYWAEPAGAGYLYQSTSVGGWELAQRFDNPVKKFLSRLDKPYEQTKSGFPQMKWKSFGGDVNDYRNSQFLGINNSPFSKYSVVMDEDWSGFGLTYWSETHAFSGSVLALSWLDEFRTQNGTHSWPFDRTLANYPNSFGTAFGYSTSDYDSMVAYNSGSYAAAGSIVIYDGNAEYNTITTRNVTRTVNIVDGPVPARVGNAQGVFNIRGQDANSPYRVSIGDKKK